MRRTGEAYFVARIAYLAEMGMPNDPPSTKDARKAAKRKEREREEAAIFDEYGEEILGVKRPAK